MKIRREKWTLWIMLAVILLAACSGDDTQSDTYVGDDTQEIRFSADVRQVKSGTRITTIDNEAGLQEQDQDIRIDAYVNGTNTSVISDARLLYADASWKFWGSGAETHYYWPIEGSYIRSTEVTSLDFVGYCPYETGYISGTNYVSSEVQISCDMRSYMTHTAQNGLTEFMCGLLQDKKYDDQVDAGGRLQIELKHPFTRIRFQLSASHPDITIHSVTLGGLKAKGTCSFNGTTSTWSDRSEDAVFVADVDQTLNTNASVQQIGTDYILIPQTFGGSITIVASWKEWGEDKSHTVSTTIPSATWDPGHSYTYTFTITETDLIVNSEKYTEQW